MPQRPLPQVAVEVAVVVTRQQEPEERRHLLEETVELAERTILPVQLDPHLEEAEVEVEQVTQQTEQAVTVQQAAR